MDIKGMRQALVRWYFSQQGVSQEGFEAIRAAVANMSDEQAAAAYQNLMRQAPSDDARIAMSGSVMEAKNFSNLMAQEAAGQAQALASETVNPMSEPEVPALTPEIGTPTPTASSTPTPASSGGGVGRTFGPSLPPTAGPQSTPPSGGPPATPTTVSGTVPGAARTTPAYRTFGPRDDVLRAHAGGLANNDEFIGIIHSAILSEGGYNPSPNGTPDPTSSNPNARSYGPFQMHDNGAGSGVPIPQRLDLNASAAKMIPQFAANYQRFSSMGYQGEELAILTIGATERPAGWVDNPNGYRSFLSTPSASNYRRNVQATFGGQGAGTGGQATGGAPATPGYRPASFPTFQNEDGSTGRGFRNDDEFLAWVDQSTFQLYEYLQGETDPDKRATAINAHQGMSNAGWGIYSQVRKNGGDENAWRTESLRIQEAGNQLSYDASVYGSNLSYGASMARLGEDARQFNARYGHEVAQAAIQNARADQKLSLETELGRGALANDTTRTQIAQQSQYLDALRFELEQDIARSGTWAQQQSAEAAWAGVGLQRDSLAESTRQFDVRSQREIEAERNKLRGDFATFLQQGAGMLGRERASASQLRASLMPWTLPQGAQYIPGMEPGGPMEQISKFAKVPFIPRGREFTNQINPDQGVSDLQAELARLAAIHPGNFGQGG